MTESKEEEKKEEGNELKKWLNSHKLGQLYDVLTREGFENKDDFLELSEEQLEQLCKKTEMKFRDSVRFKEAVKSLPAIKPEEKTMIELSEEIEKIKNFHNTVVNAIQEVKNWKESCEKESKKKFEKMKTILNEREEEILEQLEKISSQKTKQLEIQRNKAEAILDQLQNKNKECKELLQSNSGSSESKNQKKILLSSIKKSLKEPFSCQLCVDPRIIFQNYNNDQLSQMIRLYGNVGDAIKPPTITDIQLTDSKTIQIKWNSNESKTEKKNLKEYEIETMARVSLQDEKEMEYQKKNQIQNLQAMEMISNLILIHPHFYSNL